MELDLTVPFIELVIVGISIAGFSYFLGKFSGWGVFKRIMNG